MANQNRNGLIINAPGAKATPASGQTTKKLVMKPLKRTGLMLLPDDDVHEQLVPVMIYFFVSQSNLSCQPTLRRILGANCKQQSRQYKTSNL